jgi:hypothetical protein
MVTVVPTEVTFAFLWVTYDIAQRDANTEKLNKS